MRKFSRNEWIAVAVAVAIAGYLFFGDVLWRIFTGPSQASRNLQAPASNAINNQIAPEQQMQNISTTAGLEIYEVEVGAGAVATAGKNVTAHYVGVLTDGTKFDSSLDRGEPFTFALGAGQVIRGWDVGIAGMKVGGIRRLVISPELGYGAQAIGPIPANSTLVFEVQLLDVK